MHVGHQKETLKTEGLLKNSPQGCVTWLFLKLILGYDISNIQHMQPRQGIWKFGRWGRGCGGKKKSTNKKLFLLKDFLASKICQVIGRHISSPIYVCTYLCSNPSGLWKELWHLQLKVEESWCPGNVILGKFISVSFSFLMCQMGFRWKNNGNPNHL